MGYQLGMIDTRGEGVKGLQAIRYEIDYEHLKDELVTSKKTERRFNHVKNIANKYRLELTDEEFKGFYKLWVYEKDIRWMMHKMSVYNVSFIDVLITYITI